LLTQYSHIFKTALAPPPHLFLVSPWSPPLPTSDPLYYRQPLDWIPDALITTQEYTLPVLATTLRGVEEALPVVKEVFHETTAVVNEAIGSAVNGVRSWWSGKATPSSMSRAASDSSAGESSTAAKAEKDVKSVDQLGAIPSSMTGLPTVPDAVVPDDDEEEEERQRLWAPSAKNLAMVYMQAENTKGIAQGELT
jgi:hypothetical protein